MAYLTYTTPSGLAGVYENLKADQISIGQCKKDVTPVR